MKKTLLRLDAKTENIKYNQHHVKKGAFREMESLTRCYPRSYGISLLPLDSNTVVNTQGVLYLYNVTIARTGWYYFRYRAAMRPLFSNYYQNVGTAFSI